MIVDRLILFFFGPGPQAQQEEAALAEGGARKGAPVRANAGGELILDRRFKRTSDRLKNITRRKKNKKVEDKEKEARAKKDAKKSGGAGSSERKTPKRAKKKSAAKKSRTKKRITKAPVKRKTVKKAAVKKVVAKKSPVKKAPVKKVIAKKRTPPKTKTKKNAKRDIHVVFRSEEKLWGLLREGSQRSDSLYLHQEDAIEAGRSRAQFEQVDLITHRKNGTIRSVWSPR